MEEEKKILSAFIIKKNSDGSIDLENAGIEGTIELKTEDMYDDILETAKLIDRRRMQDACYVAGFNGAAKFYESLIQKKDENEETEKTIPTVEK